jgi:ornithine cyclodeaminase/alanine dehydrogenase-like protein (mu-crystallin family)
MSAIELTYLGGPEIEQLALSDESIIDAVTDGLRAQGHGETVIEPRVHLRADPSVDGHFNVLRGSIPSIGLAGVKIVGDYVENYRLGLPSEMALLNLFDPSTGMPRAILDATAITEMRTGAMTAIGARHLARADSRTLGHVGARGTAYWNVRLLDRLFQFDEIRVHSRRAESRDAFARRLGEDLGRPVIATADWRSCVEGADIVVEASRLSEPTPLLETSWIAPGALVVPYGTMSAVELSLTDVADKVVVDDWGQCETGQFGALRQHVETGRLTRETLHAELCEIVVGRRPGRESPEETIVFWHRGLSLSDIALARAVLERAAARGVGQQLRYA